MWRLLVIFINGESINEVYEDDELGTLDDTMSMFFMQDLNTIKSLSITREE